MKIGIEIMLYVPVPVSACLLCYASQMWKRFIILKKNDIRIMISKLIRTPYFLIVYSQQ